MAMPYAILCCSALGSTPAMWSTAFSTGAREAHLARERPAHSDAQRFYREQQHRQREGDLHQPLMAI